MFGFFYLKEQETEKIPENSRTTVDDGVMVQNISPNTSLPKEGMSEPYMAINTFSQLFTVIFQSNRLFLQSQMSKPYMYETYGLNLLFCRRQSQMMSLLNCSSMVICSRKNTFCLLKHRLFWSSFCICG